MDTKTFAEHIKKYRLDHQMTQDDLAQKLYVSRKTISKWETERGLPEIYMLSMISELLGISMDELIKSKTHTNQHRVSIESFIKHRTSYIFIMIFVILGFSIGAILADVPVLINQKLRFISVILLIIVACFTILIFVLNYYHHAYKIKRIDCSTYLLIFHDILKQSNTYAVMIFVISIFKIIIYVVGDINVLNYGTLITSAMILILTIIQTISNIKEIRRYVKNDKD